MTKPTTTQVERAELLTAAKPGLTKAGQVLLRRVLFDLDNAETENTRLHETLRKKEV